MKRIGYTISRWTCKPLKYLISVTFAMFFSFFMTVYVMPMSVSLLVTYIGFTDDATPLVIAFMGGVPALFMTGLFLYFSIMAIRYVHRHVFDYFGKAEKKFIEILESEKPST